MPSDEELLQQELATLQRELAPLEAQLSARKQAQEAELNALRSEGEALTQRQEQTDKELADLGARLVKAETSLRAFHSSRLGELGELLAAQRSLVALFFLMLCACLWSLLAIRKVMVPGLLLQGAGLLLGLLIGSRRRRRK